MISSGANPKIKQIIQWQNKAKERRSAGIFLTEGFKLYEEAPVSSVREVYLSESASGKIKENQALKKKLEVTGWEVVTDEIFTKMSDTQTPQGILCVLNRPEYTQEQLLRKESPLLVVLEDIQDFTYNP